MAQSVNGRAMATTHKTSYQIDQIMKYNRDGSPDKQDTRHRILHQAIKHLQDERGYGKRWKVEKLGTKDVSRLVHDWKEQGLAHRTIANRLAEVRWLASKVGRETYIPSNKDAGIALRRNCPGYGENKARELDRVKLSDLGQREQLTTELRREFGLRREEAVKFQHLYATQKEEKISLRENWTKGGRYREIAIVNDQQRDLLSRIQEFQKENQDRSMIPSHRTYKSYVKDYDKLVHRALNVKGHSYRHKWAQERFKELSNLNAPLAGGQSRENLTDEDKSRFDSAAEIVNQELGHGKGRQDITATYLGR